MASEFQGIIVPDLLEEPTPILFKLLWKIKRHTSELLSQVASVTMIIRPCKDTTQEQ